MRRIWSTSLVIALAACSSTPPPEAAPSIPFVALDSVIIARITPDALVVDKLILADTAIAMARRGASCAGVDATLDEWAAGASALNGAVALGAHLRQAGVTSRALHKIANGAVFVAGAVAGFWILDELSDPEREWGPAKVSIGVGALLKFLDATIWGSASQDARVAADVGERIAGLESAANSLPQRILTLRGRCRNPVFETQVRDLKAHQLGLVSDFVAFVDRVPARYASPNSPLMNYRQRLRWYQVRTEATR